MSLSAANFQSAPMTPSFHAGEAGTFRRLRSGRQALRLEETGS